MSTAATNTEKGASHAEMANAIRALAMDAVQKANSGHPGMPMGMADVATVLFTRFIKIDPTTTNWPDRDRFVLSAGHGSMLQYALHYLLGYPDMTIEELRNFRQLCSRTAGHPEFGHAEGIETTTGPLGQGLATSVGMALAERMANARFGDELVDHHTYTIVGDGCLMEGISHEAIDMAGHLKLGRLIVLWDDNSITIDGPTDLSTSTDQIARFKASGWHTVSVDGHDPEAVAQALEAAHADDRPSLIACKTIIGKGSPNKQGTAATHGAPLGHEEIAATREVLDWTAAPFDVPNEVLEAWRASGTRGTDQRAAWQGRLNASAKRREFEVAMSGALPETLTADINAYKATLSSEAPKVATRKASQMALEVINAAVPNMVGGSADLTGSNNTRTKNMAAVTAEDFGGSYIYYGVREHGMAAAMNGISLHGGFIPYGGTFLVFTDYCRPAIRLSALMGQRVIYVMTHDSIGLGEDGPTHQPIEQVPSLRAMPNLNVFRPADAVESAECWLAALQDTRTPSVLALSRQGLPTLRTEHTNDNLCANGAYVLREADGARDVTILASGSEVEIAIEAADALSASGIAAAVVSMPCWEKFDEQQQSYRDAVLGTAPRVAIEAAAGFGWEKWIGTSGRFVGMSSFGASAPAGHLYEHFGLTSEAVAEAAREAIGHA
ncbi:MAG: transketolase [Filomicrobium sp.]